MKKQWFTIQQIRPQLYAIAEFCHFEKVVSYLLLGDREAVLIDTGMGYESIRAAVSGLTKLPVRVLLTHGHWDHIGGASEFDDISIRRTVFDSQSLISGFHSGDIPELCDPTLFTNPFKPKKYIAPGVEIFETIENGQVIHCAPFALHVIATSGHTPGSVCIFVPAIGALFTGDTLYPGPLYGHLPESNMFRYRQSIRLLGTMVKDVRQVFPGHNATTNGPQLISEANFLFDRVFQCSLEGKRQKSGIEYKGNGISLLMKK